jgi:2-keto-4-pentenoate hydratase/2-oxohepta-3-ene-1,7-dioic acid hydratase in catechol pathway
MKIARFEYEDKENYGIMQAERLLPLPVLGRSFKTTLPSRMEEFISDENAREIAEVLLAKSESFEFDRIAVPLTEVKLLAPIRLPPKILCLGLNYASHVSETRAKQPDQPVIFMKPCTTIVGPNDRIIKRHFVKQLDYEAELAVVMGRKAKDVAVSEALDHVFGYTILNDVSARDFQFRGSQWTPGKSFDSFAPTGPCITTRDQIDASALSIKTWVNGELRQNGTTKDMIFGVAEIVSFLSQIMTLEPCDIIATGTPSGVAMAMKPAKWLGDGDRVRIEIEGIGILENTVEER